MFSNKMNSLGISLVVMLCLEAAIARNNKITLLVIQFVKVCSTFQSIDSVAFLIGEGNALHTEIVRTQIDKVNF